MTVNVPVNHPAYPQSQKITTLVALIAANANPLLKPVYQFQLVEQQRQLVDALMAHGAVPASAILSGLVFGQPDTNAV